MEPMFHIKDPLWPKRLYRITNYRNYTEIIELKQEDLCSLAKFKQKVMPGDVLTIETEIIKRKGPIGVGKAAAKVGEKVVCMAELTFAIG